VIDDRSYEVKLDARAASLATRAVHAGEDKDELALEAPIVVSTAFRLGTAEEAAAAFRGESDAPVYSRWGNRTVRHLEEAIAALEEAEGCAVAASGMAAVTGTLLAICEAGAHVVAPRTMYGESARLLRERLPRLGITTTFLDDTSVASYEAALRPQTRVLYIESPANPTLAVTDIAGVVALARANGLITVCDNTFATPFAQTPHVLGADVVVHSMTKALSGHGDVVAGAACAKKEMADRIRELVVRGLGAPLSPLAAYMAARGVRTFALRQRQACLTAARLAHRLSERPDVARVHHPSLRSHPSHAVAKKQMHAYGSLVAFELAPKDGRSPFVRAKRMLGALEVATHAVSLGDVRTLVVHPASTTHASMPEEDRKKAGIEDGLLRMSVGIEAEGDLARDLERAIDLA
jgi:methionine-gamma-lyase